VTWACFMAILKNMKKTNISVIIPCYNQIKFLEECLQSVLSQTVPDWDAIIVDDGSDDGETISSVVAKIGDRRIRLIRHPENKGLAAARNTGIRASEAEFVLPLDSDDELAPDYIEQLFPLLENRPEIDCVFPDLQAFGASDGIHQLEVRDIFYLLQQQWLPGAGTLMRKSLWEKIGGYCEEKALRVGNEDWDFWLGAAEVGFNAAHLPEPLYRYRQQAGSMGGRLIFFDYRTRQVMYKRHHHLFDRFKARNNFLVAGYLKSAEAYLRHEGYLKAVYLAAQASLLPVRRRESIHLMISAIKSSLHPHAIKIMTKKGVGRIARAALPFVEKLSKKWYRLRFVRKLYWDLAAYDIDRRYGGLKHDYETLELLIAKMTPRRILDVGCGSGRLFPLYQSMGIKEIYGQDISRAALNLAKDRFNDPAIQLLHTPITDLNFPDSYFDLAISNRVLELIPPDAIRQAIHKIGQLSRFVYLNEMSASDIISIDPKVFTHNYDELFFEQGFYVKEEGFITSEANTCQKWTLYGRA
jgi:glycosyltransferase involved in cell wall biosynthesis